MANRLPLGSLPPVVRRLMLMGALRGAQRSGLCGSTFTRLLLLCALSTSASFTTAMSDAIFILLERGARLLLLLLLLVADGSRGADCAYMLAMEVGGGGRGRGRERRRSASSSSALAMPCAFLGRF